MTKGTLLHRWRDCKLIQPLWKSVEQFLRKTGIGLLQDLAIPLLGIYPKNMSSYHSDMSSTVFVAALFITARS